MRDRWTGEEEEIDGQFVIITLAVLLFYAGVALGIVLLSGRTNAGPYLMSMLEVLR